jgi:hypothetical protein
MVKIYEYINDTKGKLLYEGSARNVVEQSGQIYVGQDAYSLEGAHLTGYDSYTDKKIEENEIEKGEEPKEDKTTNQLNTLINLIKNIEKLITDTKTKTIDIYKVLNGDISKTLNSINDNTKTMIDKLGGLKNNIINNTYVNNVQTNNQPINYKNEININVSGVNVSDKRDIDMLTKQISMEIENALNNSPNVVKNVMIEEHYKS